MGTRPTPTTRLDAAPVGGGATYATQLEPQHLQPRSSRHDTPRKSPPTCPHHHPKTAAQHDPPQQTPDADTHNKSGTHATPGGESDTNPQASSGDHSPKPRRSRRRRHESLAPRTTSHTTTAAAQPPAEKISTSTISSNDSSHRPDATSTPQPQPNPRSPRPETPTPTTQASSKPPDHLHNKIQAKTPASSKSDGHTGCRNTPNSSPPTQGLRNVQVTGLKTRTEPGSRINHRARIPQGGIPPWGQSSGAYTTSRGRSARSS